MTAHTHPATRSSHGFGVALTTAIVALALTTGYIHLGLGGMLFTLNALGYAGLAALYVIGSVAPLPLVARFSWFPRVALGRLRGTHHRRLGRPGAVLRTCLLRQGGRARAHRPDRHRLRPRLWKPDGPGAQRLRLGLRWPQRNGRRLTFRSTHEPRPGSWPGLACARRYIGRICAWGLSSVSSDRLIGKGHACEARFFSRYAQRRPIHQRQDAWRVLRAPQSPIHRQERRRAGD